MTGNDDNLQYFAWKKSSKNTLKYRREKKTTPSHSDCLHDIRTHKQRNSSPSNL